MALENIVREFRIPYSKFNVTEKGDTKTLTLTGYTTSRDNLKVTILENTLSGYGFRLRSNDGKEEVILNGLPITINRFIIPVIANMFNATSNINRQLYPNRSYYKSPLIVYGKKEVIENQLRNERLYFKYLPADRIKITFKKVEVTVGIKRICYVADIVKDKVLIGDIKDNLIYQHPMYLIDREIDAVTYIKKINNHAVKTRKYATGKWLLDEYDMSIAQVAFTNYFYKS